MNFNPVSSSFNTCPGSPPDEQKSSNTNEFKSFTRQQSSYPNPYHYLSTHQLPKRDVSNYIAYSSDDDASSYNDDDDPEVYRDSSDFPTKKALGELLLKIENKKDVKEDIESTLFQKRYRPKASDMDVDEYMAIASYTCRLHQPLNEMLRKDPNKIDHPVAQALNRGLQKLARHPDNIETHVLRGINKTYSDNEIEKMFKPGSIISDPAFMSTTTDKFTAKNHTKSVQLHISSRSAVKVKDFSNQREEEEAIIPANTSLRVTGLQKKDQTWHVNLVEGTSSSKRKTIATDVSDSKKAPRIPGIPTD